MKLNYYYQVPKTEECGNCLSSLLCESDPAVSGGIESFDYSNDFTW